MPASRRHLALGRRRGELAGGDRRAGVVVRLRGRRASGRSGDGLVRPRAGRRATRAGRWCVRRQSHARWRRHLRDAAHRAAAGHCYDLVYRHGLAVGGDGRTLLLGSTTGACGRVPTPATGGNSSRHTCRRSSRSPPAERAAARGPSAQPQLPGLADEVVAEAVVRLAGDEFVARLLVDAACGDEDAVGPQADRAVAGLAREALALATSAAPSRWPRAWGSTSSMRSCATPASGAFVVPSRASTRNAQPTRAPAPRRSSRPARGVELLDEAARDVADQGLEAQVPAVPQAYSAPWRETTQPMSPARWARSVYAGGAGVARGRAAGARSPAPAAVPAAARRAAPRAARRCRGASARPAGRRPCARLASAPGGAALAGVVRRGVVRIRPRSRKSAEQPAQVAGVEGRARARARSRWRCRAGQAPTAAATGERELVASRPRGGRRYGACRTEEGRAAASTAARRGGRRRRAWRGQHRTDSTKQPTWVPEACNRLAPKTV